MHESHMCYGKKYYFIWLVGQDTFSAFSYIRNTFMGSSSPTNKGRLYLTAIRVGTDRFCFQLCMNRICFLVL